VKAKLIPQTAEVSRILATPLESTLLRAFNLGTTDDTGMTIFHFGAAFEHRTRIEQCNYAYECNHDLSNSGNWVGLASEI
jgi:hypothetical protein